MKIHVVQKGDTLWEISQKYNADFEELKEMNPQLSSPDMIMPGMKIKVPSSTKPVQTQRTAETAAGETQSETANTAGKRIPVMTEDEERMEKPVKSHMPLQPSQTPKYESPPIKEKPLPNLQQPNQETPPVKEKPKPLQPIQMPIQQPVKEKPKPQPQQPIQQTPMQPIAPMMQAPIFDQEIQNFMTMNNFSQMPFPEPKKEPVKENNTPITQQPAQPMFVPQFIHVLPVCCHMPPHCTPVFCGGMGSGGHMPAVPYAQAPQWQWGNHNNMSGGPYAAGMPHNAVNPAAKNCGCGKNPFPRDTNAETDIPDSAAVQENTAPKQTYPPLNDANIQDDVFPEPPAFPPFRYEDYSAGE